MFLNNEFHFSSGAVVFKNTPTNLANHIVYKCLRTDPRREVFSFDLGQIFSRVLKETAPSGLSTKSKGKKSWYSQTIHLTVSAKIQGPI